MRANIYIDIYTYAFDWQYLFDIGIEAASKIYSYALANSSEAEFEPYMKRTRSRDVDRYRG